MSDVFAEREVQHALKLRKADHEKHLIKEWEELDTHKMEAFDEKVKQKPRRTQDARERPWNRRRVSERRTWICKPRQLKSRRRREKTRRRLRSTAIRRQPLISSRKTGRSRSSERSKRRVRDSLNAKLKSSATCRTEKMKS